MYDRGQKVKPEIFWWDYLNISKECAFQGGMSKIQGKSGSIIGMKQYWVVKPEFENFSAAEIWLESLNLYSSLLFMVLWKMPYIRTELCLFWDSDSDLSNKHLYSDTKCGLNSSMPISGNFQFKNNWMINVWLEYVLLSVNFLFYHYNCRLTACMCTYNHS
jgi:hypothetical protein